MVHITHVMVSYSHALLSRIDEILPAGSLLILEEPEVASARRVFEEAALHACVGGVDLAPVQDPSEVWRLGDLIARPDAVRAVFAGTEYGVVGAAVLAEAWGLPGLGSAAAATCRHKAALRAAVSATDVAQPRWRECSTLDEALKLFSSSPGRFVVKPSGRQGSLGVRVVDSVEGMTAAWRAVLSLEERARATSAGADRVLVEEFAEGDEFSVEAVVHRGKVTFFNVTEKDLFDGEYPVERGHLVPAPIDDSTTSRLRSAMEGLVAACDMDTGLLHVEWILADGVAQLVECAARLPGDGIIDLIDSAYGASLVTRYIRLHEGDDHVAFGTSGASRTAGVRFLRAPQGYVAGVEGIDEARTTPGVVAAAVTVTAGDTVSALVSSADRCGYVMVVGEDPASVRDALDLAESRVRIVLDPSHSTSEHALDVPGQEVGASSGCRREDLRA